MPFCLPILTYLGILKLIQICLYQALYHPWRVTHINIDAESLTDYNNKIKQIV